MKHTFGEFAELLSDVQCCTLARAAYLLEMLSITWDGREGVRPVLRVERQGREKAKRHCNKDESMLSLPNSGIVMEFCSVSAGSFSL